MVGGRRAIILSEIGQRLRIVAGARRPAINYRLQGYRTEAPIYLHN